MSSDLPLLPCLEPNDAPQARTLSAASDFAYLGTPLTAAEFTNYLASYDFGAIKPDQVVLHNTANPDASWAALGTSDRTYWDRDEAGLSLTAIRNKRNRQLDAIKSYYVGLGWDAGPHLFIDDRWIWLFTPLDTVGIHAKEGNSYTALGKLHYTIGIEVIGWYGKVAWPFAIQTMVRSAVQSLQKRLGTFEIVYRQAPPHRPAAHQGSVAFHYDYNKPACPGAKITPAWAISVLQAQSSSLPDPFAAWGDIDRPTGVSQGFGVPQAWLKHQKTLGACLRGERYDLPSQISRALFQGGEIRYFLPTNTIEVLPYPQKLPAPKELIR